MPPARAKRTIRSYSREELRAAIGQGQRCVAFGYCYSLVHTVHGESEIQVVGGRLDGVRRGLVYTLATALFGWWGLHGLYLTPYYLFVNLCGGRDLTAQVWAALDSDAWSRLLVTPDFSPFELEGQQAAASPGEFLRTLADDQNNRRESSSA